VNSDVHKNDAVEDKLVAARTWLIIDKPFLGALVLRLPLVEADPGWCPTTATDARSIFYNPGYIRALTFEQTKFVLAHEALHCALSHFSRREHRHQHRWDLACDFAVNPLLTADGLTPPPGALFREAYRDMSAEEIYPYIRENDSGRTLDRHIFDQDGLPSGTNGHGGMSKAAMGDSGDRDASGESQGGALPPTPLSAPEREMLDNQWKQRLAAAAHHARKMGKLSHSIARKVDQLLQPQLPWRLLLAHYMTQTTHDDYSFAHPSRREGSAILPGLHSRNVDLVVALDTSGSISDEEMREFLSEINAIKGQVGARIVLLACDERLAEDGPWTFEPWDEVGLPKQFQGGGGTKFTPVFEWADEQDRPPNLLLYFTDAKGEFPEHEPSYPVLWLVKGKEQVPWGQRIQLN
jgi:predicted metal-dependent peptidase